MATHELTHTAFSVPLPHEDRDLYAADIKPNMPWAEDHFRERVCGYPINPGLEWQNWPYNKSAASFLDDRGMFNHNYMERYWPKHAGYVAGPHETADQFIGMVDVMPGSDPETRRGIMYNYGDLGDVVQLLSSDPYTRQAYLPVWFPEDTGGGSKRAPCTIGYHFLMRDGKLDINYHIRSCDFVRHFRDDLYLTVRLLLWVLESCRLCSRDWNDVTPGLFIMQIGSLHIFRNDYHMLYGSAQ
jgi:thymidylate synthase